MGSLSSNFKDLALNALGATSDESDLKTERANALLEQKNNVNELKKKLSSYRAKMASSGAGSLNGGVEKGLTEEVQDKNQKIALSFNQKVKNKTKNNRQKALLVVDDLI